MIASGTAPTIIGTVSRAPAARLESGVDSLMTVRSGANAEKRERNDTHPDRENPFFIVPITGRDTVEYSRNQPIQGTRCHDRPRRLRPQDPRRPAREWPPDQPRTGRTGRALGLALLATGEAAGGGGRHP